jgi:hypothetical protein
VYFRRECWYGFKLREQGYSIESAWVSREAVVIHLAVDQIAELGNPDSWWTLGMGPRVTRRRPISKEVQGDTAGITFEVRERREADPSLCFSLKLCKKWLSICRQGHRHCWPCPTDAPRFLPRRLLDVGDSRQQSIRLVRSKDIEESAEASYVALSYCWGATNDAARTTIENLADRLEAIQFISLPRTIQDAITLTRGLNIRYLWVDALCIIQGDTGNNSDWRKELPNMGLIYDNSLLTIAASSASSSDAGFLDRKDGACWPLHDICLYDDRLTKIAPNVIKLEGYIPEWYNVNKACPLSKRGWVLQERMLASRTLSWTNDGIFWQCREGEASEYEDILVGSSVSRGLSPIRASPGCRTGGALPQPG